MTLRKADVESHAPKVKLSEFDRFADDYEAVHNRGLPPGVRSRDFLLQKFNMVQQWVYGRCQREQGITVLDFGCGTGRLLSQIASADWCRSVIGVDESVASLERTRAMLAATGKCFWLGPTLLETGCSEKCDLALMFNVLHHIPVERRLDLVRQVVSVLVEDGILAVWEHNPWNPATRLLVSVSPLDVHARLISRRTVVALMRQAGLDCEDSRYVNLVPPALAGLAPVRWAERVFSRVPAGTQYWALFKRSRL